MTHVVVTGLGAVTPAGSGIEATWEGVCRGDSTAATDPALAGMPITFSCRAPDVEDAVDPMALWRLDRSSQLALAATREAIAAAGLDPDTWEAPRVGVVIGSSLGGAAVWHDQLGKLTEHGPGRVSAACLPMLLANTPCGEVALAVGARGPSLAPVTACATGTTALAVAHDLLVTGQCDVVLAGGAEAGTTPLVVTAFHRCGALSTRNDDPAAASRPFAPDRSGLVVAEGAAVLVLERAETARARKAPVRAILAGCGQSTDAHHPTSPHPDATGSQQAVEAALRHARLEPEAIEHVNAHATGTRLGDAAEALMIGRLFPHRPPVTSVKGSLGHSLGAAGAVEAALAVLTLERGLVPPTAHTDHADPAFGIDLVTKVPRQHRADIALSTSFGFGGHNAAVILRHPRAL
ncbi:beta-ketoacyl-[acyl-carrier-protein] synthase family protein [Streptomyces sp. URMC 124]|uniref:beta-ketoacyl-[acyl-carrier-protein] synthase family protein n=1 Tax=Streptomyces sp. URMC 124 TaxID=3423405 RepID=UPI003F1A7FBC